MLQNYFKPFFIFTAHFLKTRLKPLSAFVFQVGAIQGISPVQFCMYALFYPFSE
jgi:hypothetical protein